MEVIRFQDDGASRWLGTQDFHVISPDGNHKLTMRYAGEPPHGDSYHELTADERTVPGWFWGNDVAFGKSRYFIGSWMAAKFERKTAIVDLELQEICEIPTYLPGKLAVRWPVITSTFQGQTTTYVVTGREEWRAF
jgi:hypothetical protein